MRGEHAHRGGRRGPDAKVDRGQEHARPARINAERGCAAAVVGHGARLSQEAEAAQKHDSTTNGLAAGVCDEVEVFWIVHAQLREPKNERHQLDANYLRRLRRLHCAKVLLAVEVVADAGLRAASTASTLRR